MRKRKISGQTCVKILCNKYGFEKALQRGSHVVLKKETSAGKIGTVVPMHKELKTPTLKKALKLAGINEEDFMKYI